MQKYIAQAAVFATSLLIAAILLVVGVGYLTVAAYFALCVVLAPPLAALATGIGLMLLAIAVILLGRLLGKAASKSERRRQAARLETAPDGVRGLAADLGILAGEEIAALARSHKHGTLVASLLAGFAVGANPGLRRMLRELIDP